MIGKYYSLDECSNIEHVENKLNNLQDDGKIFWLSPEQDIIKIKDNGLSIKEMKDLISFFEKNDVIEYVDYVDMYNDDDDDDDDDDDSDFYNENEYYYD